MTPTIEYDRISHLTLPVHDLQVAEEFYVGILGAKLAHKMDRDEFLRLRPGRIDEVDAENSPLHLALSFGDELELQVFLQPRNVRQPVEQPHPHLALLVDADQLLPAKRLLVSHGIPVDGPIRLGPPGHASIYFFDPFGNHLELATMGFDEALEVRVPDHTRLVYSWDSRAPRP
jgi:catechol 2,3-dioxygenase-like lactoylglutathione lyase family enzyme